MTPAAMNPLTRRELANLRNATKNEVLAYVRNRMQLVIAAADAIATNTANDPREDAHALAFVAREFTTEFETLLAPSDARDHNGHLGGKEATA